MINKAIIIGRMTKDVEIKMTQSGKKVGRFTVACDRGKRNGESLGTDFVTCVAWEQRADILQNYTRKGSLIGVEGRIQTGSYDDPNFSGRKVFTTDILVDNISLLESKPKEESAPAEYYEPATFEINVDEDLPF